MNLVGLGFVGFAAILLFILSLTQRKTSPKFRVITPLSRLYRSIGLSVENGSRLLIGLGGPSLLTRNGASPLAGLGTLRPLVERTSLTDLPPIAAAGEASLAILAQDSLEGGYKEAGVAETYQATAGRLTGMTPFSSAAGMMPILHDENVSATLLIGHFGVEAALLADAAERESAFLLGSSDDLSAQAVLFAAAQETLLGEELYSTSAYIGAHPAHMASLSVQDILRWIIIAVLLVGAGFKLFGLI